LPKPEKVTATLNGFDGSIAIFVRKAGGRPLSASTKLAPLFEEA